MKTIEMKKHFKKLVCGALAILFILCLLPVVKADASPIGVKYAKKVTVSWSLNGNARMHALDMGNRLKKAKKVTAESSDPGTVEVVVSPSKPYAISFITHKKGTATVKIKVKKKGQELKTYKMKVSAVSFKNPVKSLKIGKKQYAKKFENGIQASSSKNLKGKKKISVTPAKGWKVKSIKVGSLMDDELIDVKNKTTFNFNQIEDKSWAQVQVVLEKKKTGQQETVFVTAY